MSQQANYEAMPFRAESRRLEEMDDERDEQGLEESIYPVKCDCGYRGMADDLSYLRCPNCGDRVTISHEE